MLNDIICKKREELNKSIVSGQDYSVIYEISVELDELIAQFYRDTKEKKNKKNSKRSVIFIKQ